MTRAIGRDVLDARLIVDVLSAVGEIQSVQRARCRVAIQRSVDVRARQRSTGRERERVQLAVAPFARLHCSYVKGGFALALDFIVIDVRAVAEHHLGNGVGEVLAVAQRHIALDEHSL